jgi:hypothetical protein
MGRKTLAVEPDAEVKARVLVRTHFDGAWHEPDSVISASAALIKGLEDQGIVDSDEGAVSYAESLKN